MAAGHVRVDCAVVVVVFHHCTQWVRDSARRSCTDCELTVPFVSAQKKEALLALLSSVLELEGCLARSLRRLSSPGTVRILSLFDFLHHEMKRCRLWVVFLLFSCSCDSWEPPLEAAAGRCTSMSLTPSRKASSGQHRYCLWSSHC